MNARILRKWSIHTKNLMSCSACSLVVVVLLLPLLLLVICAPIPVLATLNHNSNNNNSPRSDASLAVNLMHMPKNVVVGQATPPPPPAAALPLSSRMRQLTTATIVSTTDTATTSSTSASLPATLPATATTLTNRNYRLASPRVEVAEDNDDNYNMKRRESFPGFYTNHRKPDDIQPTLAAPWPLPLRHQLPLHTARSNGATIAGGGGGGLAASPAWIINVAPEDNKQDILNRRMGWPSRRLIATTKPMESYSNYNTNDDDVVDDDEDDDEDEGDAIVDVDDGITQASDNEDDAFVVQTAESQHDEEYDVVDDDDTIVASRSANNNGRQQLDTIGVGNSYIQHHFPAQLYNLRRPNDRRRQVATQTVLAQAAEYPQAFASSRALSTSSSVSPLSSSATTLQNQQQLPTLMKRQTLNTKYSQIDSSSSSSGGVVKNGGIIFSTTDNKSVPGTKDNVFDISNILNVNKIKSSAAMSPIRFVIESYEVAATPPLTKPRRLINPNGTASIVASAITAPQSRTLKQLRSRQELQQQAARNRRDSLRGSYTKRLAPSSSSSSSTRKPAQQQYNHQHHQQQHHNNAFRQQQHHHQHNHHNQQRQRKHSRRYCSARDPAQLAFEAPTVFEGKIVSMTPDRRSNFSATVEVREVFKQQIGFRLQKYLRLQFAYRNSSGECDIYREQLRPRGLIKGDTIEQGRMYLLFVQQIDIGNFTILGQPIRKTKRVVEAVRNAVSENYAQLASIRSISASNRTVENGQELRIVCKVTGRPPPKVTWFKDHRSINRNRKLYQFTHYKKRSELIIRSFNTSDAGRYECRAKNKVNRNIERRAIVIKAYPVQRFDPNPRGAGNTCPDDASEFCFNGGTCKFFSEISSYSCICPEGFIGERCDRKEVNNPSTYSNEQECGDKKYFGSYYC